jgi:hypothetical protein
MSMTRKDYDRIAFHLAMQEPDMLHDGKLQKLTIQFEADCMAVADALMGSNPRFRREYFLEACKFDYWTNRKQPR